MPPPRRKKITKKRQVLRTSESQDDDVFEDEETKPIKIIRRFRAREKPATNSKASSTSKHVEKKRIMSSSPEMGKLSETSTAPIVLDSEVRRFEVNFLRNGSTLAFCC